MPDLDLRLGFRLVSLITEATGLSRAIRIRRHSRRDYRLYVLAYHDVSPLSSAEAEGVISQTRFQRHVRYLKRIARIERLDRSVESLTASGGLTQDVVVLTFDDGYEDNFLGAGPILQAEQVSATIFLTTGFLDGQELWFDFARRSLEAAQEIGSDLPEGIRSSLVDVFGTWPEPMSMERKVKTLKYLPPEARDRLLESLRKAPLALPSAARPLSWSQVRSLQRGGIEIGCHTVSHPILSAHPLERQRQEIRRSKERIQQETGISPTSFAIPNGSSRDYNEATLEILKAERFRAVCTMCRGSNRIGQDPFTLRRIGVGSDPTWVLGARLSGLFDEEFRRLLRRGYPRT